MATPPPTRMPAPHSPPPSPSGNQLRSHPSSLFATALACSFSFLHCTFYDHTALCVHIDKLTLRCCCCCCCLACSVLVDARQARPLLEFPRSCERSHQSVADASGLLICDFSNTANCCFFFLKRSSPCVPFHGCAWKLLHLGRLANRLRLLLLPHAGWLSARLWGFVEIKGVQNIETTQGLGGYCRRTRCSCTLCKKSI